MISLYHQIRKDAKGVGCKTMYHYYCYIISNDYKKHVVMDVTDCFECVEILYIIHSEVLNKKS